MRFPTKLLPLSLQKRLIHQSVKIRRIGESDDFEFRLATTQEELEASYRLLHDAYVELGIMDPHPSRLRCNIFSALPYTATIIAKFQGKVIGTVSLIKDSPLGFPSDKVYLDINDDYRRQGFRIAEVSALAVDPDFRRFHGGASISLYLIRFIYEYAQKYMGVNMFCCSVHPRSEAFYGGLFNFKRRGPVVRYEFVKNALAIHLASPLPWSQWLEKNFKYHPPETNFRDFFELERPKQLLFPQRDLSLQLDPVMTPELLRYFFVERTQLLRNLTIREFQLLKSAYALHFPMDLVFGSTTKIWEELERPLRNFHLMGRV